MEGVDYAWARPDLDELWAAGKRFVCRYLAYLPNGKVLGSSERAALHAKGFAIVLNWEQSSGDMTKGYATGVTHATEALRQANALGAPSWVPIYFSCDVNVVNPTQLDAVQAYLNGAASMLGRSRVGVYAQYSVIEALVPGTAAYGWQTYAWSNGKVSARAHFLQYHNGVIVAGADCDLNRSLQDAFGAWSPDSTPQPPVAVPLVKEDSMSIPILRVINVPAAPNNVDIHGVPVPETGLVLATPAGRVSVTANWWGSMNPSAPANVGKNLTMPVLMTVTWAEAQQLCESLRQPSAAPIDVTALAGALAPLLPAGAPVSVADLTQALIAALAAPDVQTALVGIVQAGANLAEDS
jgi:hypothetical protein